MKKRTIPYMLDRAVRKFTDSPYVWEKKNSPVYKKYSFADVQKMAGEIAAGLIDLGIEKGDRVALLSEGRLDWVVTELGILLAGGVNVPLSIKLLESGELKFRLIHSGCRYAFASESQQKKILDLKDDLPDMDCFISLDSVDSEEPDEIDMQTLKEKGKKLLEIQPGKFLERWQSVEEEDLAVISYTSGTTSNPKGIMLMHRNFVANVQQIAGVYDLKPGEKIFLVIPWDHSFAHTAGLYASIYMGCGIAAVDFGKSPMEALRNFPKNIQEVKPEYILSVPVLSENLKKNIEKGIRMKGDKVYKLFRKSLKTAYLYNKTGWDKGKTLKQKLHKPMLLLYDKILFSKIREQLGGNLKYFVGGGPVLDTGLQRFFYALGMPIYQGYGLTETAPVISSNVEEAHKMGSSGQPLPGLEVKIVDEDDNVLSAGEKGEILTRGDNVMKGYWKNENATN
ncbi:MAG: AMP-binding protein, partial [Calditrichia bacterium]|nr:AMP-binding protein [Calditrichia bacterium]